jgi:YVTN family beta-propeller protein
VVVLAIALVAVLATSGDGGGGNGGASPTATQPPRAEPAPEVTATLQVGQHASHVGGDGRGIWVTDDVGKALFEINPATNAVSKPVAVDGTPHAVAVFGNFAWSTVLPVGLVKVDDRADPPTTSTFPTPIPVVEVATGESGVWGTTGDDGQLVRVDPATGDVLAVIKIGDSADSVVVGEGAVWVGIRTNPGFVARVDPATNQVVARIGVGANPDQLAVGGGSVWSANVVDGTLSRIDPATNTVATTIDVGANAASVAVGGGAAWTMHPDTGTVTRIDMRTNRVTQRLNVGGRPESSVWAAGSLWVVQTASSEILRIKQ